jgi:hypothetical protein
VRQLPEIPLGLRQKIGEYLEWETESPEYAATQMFALTLCRLLGHLPVLDHCGLPEHDYCAGCGERTPGQGRRERAELTGPEIDELVAEAEQGYDLDKLVPRPKDGPSEASH